MEFKYAICFVACLALASCMPEHRPVDLSKAPSEQEERKAASPAMPAVIPVPTVSKEALAQSKKFEKQADKIANRFAGVRDIDKALDMAGSAIDYYKKAIDLDNTNDKLVHKYVRAIEIKYNLLIPDGEREDEKKKVYADTLALLERLHPGGNNSAYADFDIVLLLILNNVYYSIFQSIGAANRTRDLCEKIYNEDKTFEDYSAAAVLGRLHCLAPNIPFIMGWPDKNKSRQYFEEALNAVPGSLLIKFFLADTLYALNEKDKAIGYYREVVSAKPRQDINYFEDKKIQRNCGIRMKELNIQ
jgi:tetratricopeptide (TPR) repeat protein